VDGNCGAQKNLLRPVLLVGCYTFNFAGPSRTPQLPLTLNLPDKEAFMIRPKNSAAFISLASLALMTMFLTLSVGCGSSSHSSQNLTAAQAQAVSQEIDKALTAALSGLSAEKNRSLAKTVPDLIRNQSLPSCTTNSGVTTCNISDTVPCPGGGTIGVSGDFNFTLNGSGDGSDSSSMTITPANCSVSNLTINGDPSLTVATQINIANDAPTFPIMLTETGGISYGPNPSGSCTVNETMTISSMTSCTITGTMCGQTVSGGC